MGTLSQDVVLEGQCACHRSQKGGKCERRHTSHSKTIISDWETGLNPLKIGEDRVGDALDCLFEQSVEPLERRMRHWRRTTQQMKNFWSTERCSQKYQCVLRGNVAQPFNRSREIILLLLLFIFCAGRALLEVQRLARDTPARRRIPTAHRRRLSRSSQRSRCGIRLGKTSPYLFHQRYTQGPDFPNFLRRS